MKYLLLDFSKRQNQKYRITFKDPQCVIVLEILLFWSQSVNQEKVNPKHAVISSL